MSYGGCETYDDIGQKRKWRYHLKICTWYAGTNTANVNVTDGVLSATRKACGGHSCGGDDGLSGTGYPGRD